VIADNAVVIAAVNGLGIVVKCIEPDICAEQVAQVLFSGPAGVVAAALYSHIGETDLSHFARRLSFSSYADDTVLT
jgi:hypothetical protein